MVRGVTSALRGGPAISAACVIAVALLIVGRLASARSAGTQHTTDCVWVEQGNSAVQECQQWDLTGRCTNCCTHEHLAMNWSICINQGDERKFGTTNKYFTAISRVCAGGPIDYSCDQTGQGPCSHFKKDCSTVSCEDQ